MIDRTARQNLARVIRSYMGNEITAFKLDEALSQAVERSGDQTAKDIAHAFWFYYDDCKDHRIVANKGEWDQFNRWLLLLESGAELQTRKGPRRFGWTNAAAALLLTAFLFVAYRVGWGDHLFIYAFPFGIGSIFLSWASERKRRCSSAEQALLPFQNRSALLQVRRAVVPFEKMRYPKSLAARRVRGTTMGWLMLVPSWILWCMFSPLALLFQIIPTPEQHTSVVLPAADTGKVADPQPKR